MTTEMQARSQSAPNVVGETMSGEITLELIDRHIRDVRAKCRELKQTLDWLKINLRLEQKKLKACTARISELEARARLAIRAGSDLMALYVQNAIKDQRLEEDALNLGISDLQSRLEIIRFSIQRKRRQLVELKRAREIAARRKKRSASGGA
ncbi:MAG: hypothetical protein KF874_13255 [Rhizobiaceae bacterium]|nr:hypothetical protein [Rhizobiaceae bacterium]